MSVKSKQAVAVQSPPEGDKKGQIIAALVNSIADIGFERTTIRAVAERAGVSPGLLTYYFKDKKELVGAAIESALAAITRSVEQASVSFGPERVRLIMARYLRDGYAGALPLGFWLQIQAAAATDPAVRNQVYGWMSDGRSKTRKSVETAIESGKYSGDLDADLTARIMYAVMTGLAVEMSVSRELTSSDQAMDVVDQLLAVLRTWKLSEAAAELRNGDVPQRVGHILADDASLSPAAAERLSAAFRLMYEAVREG